METPEKIKCAKCGETVPLAELDADENCVICAALLSLKETLEKRGLLHPSLFDKARSSLPPSDRE